MTPAVASTFAKQAEWSVLLGSPFMARLCEALPRALAAATGVGRTVGNWPGDAFADALVIRLAGGLHALVRRGAAPALAALYPPAPTPGIDVLAAALAGVLARYDAWLVAWLDAPPQTNEVGRAAALMAGLLDVTARTRLPLRLFELGASAGLNLRLDAYGYDLGGRVLGPPAAPVRLTPDWQGPPPPNAKLDVIARRGVDIAPIDVTDPAARERLIAFVWPDQVARLERLAAALAEAAADPPPIDRADAAGWVEATVAPVTGATTVVFHSIAYQYFPATSQARIAAHMDAMGSRARADQPLAWLRYELDAASDNTAPPTLRLRLWPDGTDRLLARVHPHGSSVSWLGEG